MNGCIWGQQKGQKISKVHRGEINLDSLKTTIAENISLQLKLIPGGLDQFLATRAKGFTGSAKGIVAAVAQEMRLNKVEAGRTLEEYVKHETHKRIYSSYQRGNTLDNSDRLKAGSGWTRSAVS